MIAFFAYKRSPLGKTTDEIKADDVTVSIIREAKPVKLLQYLKEHGYSLTNPYSGIYYIGEKAIQYEFSTLVQLRDLLNLEAEKSAVF